jgi:predicted deacetylase
MKHKYLAFHDLSWNNYNKLEIIFERLITISQNKLCVVVIPYCPAENLDDFKKYLQNLKSKGILLLCHGYKHHVEETKGRSFLGKRLLVQTNYEAEFAGLNKQDAAELWELSQKAWNALELGEMIGFVPPTWHISSIAQKIITKEIPFFETRCFLKNPHRNYFSLPLSLFGENHKTWKKSFALCQAMGNLPLLSSRLVLHPVDFERNEFQKALWEWIEHYCRNGLEQYPLV